MIPPLSSEDKMDVIRLFSVERRTNDLRELRLATRLHSRTHTITYTVTCHSLWEREGEPSVTGIETSLKNAVAAAASAFMQLNNRNDWQVSWSAICTIARKDGTWSLNTLVPDAELLAHTPKRDKR